MSYKIVDIEGIGPVYAEKLIAAGIVTVDQLLEKGKTPKGRKELEDVTGITGKLILTWVNHADLFELANRKPENLVAKLNEVNEAKKLVRRVPALVEVEKMVAQAKKLDRVITY